MIPPEDIKERLRRSPFKPFALVMADGKRYEVQHPEQAWVHSTSVFVGVPPKASAGTEQPPFGLNALFFNQGHVAQLSVFLITRLEVHESEQPKQ